MISIIAAESNLFEYGRKVLCFYSMCQNKREEPEKQRDGISLQNEMKK